MSIGHYLVPHQLINRLAILDKSAVNSLVLLATSVCHTVNHYTDVVLFMDVTRQLLSHHFAYHGNKVIAAFIVCIRCVNIKSILLERKNCLIFGKRQFLFGNHIRSVEFCFSLLPGFLFYSLPSSLQSLNDRRVLDQLLLCKASITGTKMSAMNAMFLQTFFFECVAILQEILFCPPSGEKHMSYKSFCFHPCGKLPS